VRDSDTAFTAELMMKSARRRVLLADASKAGSSASVVYGNLKDFDLLITSSSLDAATARRFQRLTKVRIAKIGDIS
jgi:DeoR/GlpR family transcriptional regulator of sugar metabolism